MVKSRRALRVVQALATGDWYVYFHQIISMETSDTAIILECMNFILRSNEIEDHEFQTRLGVDRPTLAAVIERYHDFDGENDVEELCVNNCLNEVCHGLQLPEDQWSVWFTNSKAAVIETYRRWAHEKGRNTGIL